MPGRDGDFSQPGRRNAVRPHEPFDGERFLKKSSSCYGLDCIMCRVILIWRLIQRSFGTLAPYAMQCCILHMATLYCLLDFDTLLLIPTARTRIQGWEPNPLVLLRAHRALPGSSSTSIGSGGSIGGGVGEKCCGSCGLGDKDLVWVQLGNPTHHPKSFNAQPTFVTTLVDKHQKPFLMLMSDNW